MELFRISADPIALLAVTYRKFRKGFSQFLYSQFIFITTDLYDLYTHPCSRDNIVNVLYCNVKFKNDICFRHNILLCCSWLSLFCIFYIFILFWLRNWWLKLFFTSFYPPKQIDNLRVFMRSMSPNTILRVGGIFGNFLQNFKLGGRKVAFFGLWSFSRNAVELNAPS